MLSFPHSCGVLFPLQQELPSRKSWKESLFSGRMDKQEWRGLSALFSCLSIFCIYCSYCTYCSCLLVVLCFFSCVLNLYFEHLLCVGCCVFISSFEEKKEMSMSMLMLAKFGVQLTDK